MKENQVLSTSENGTIIYQQLSPKYLEDTYKIVREINFTSGTVCRMVGVPEDPEALSELDQISIATVKDGISLIAIDKNNDKVVGYALNKILVRSQPFFENFENTFNNFKSQQILEFIIDTDNTVDLFDHCKVNCTMEILFLGVLPEYRKKGIAKKLCELSVKIAQNLHNGLNVKQGVDGQKLELGPVPEAVYAIFTSFIGQNIGKRLGFQVAATKSSQGLTLKGKVLDNGSVGTSTIEVQYKMLQ